MHIAEGVEGWGSWMQNAYHSGTCKAGREHAATSRIGDHPDRVTAGTRPATGRSAADGASFGFVSGRGFIRYMLDSRQRLLLLGEGSLVTSSIGLREIGLKI